MSEVAIQVEHVWKKFRKGELHDSLRDLIPAIAKRLIGRRPNHNALASNDFWALQDISFSVKRGESLGIIGPNGAGKSTMLKLLSRIIKPNRGTYRVNGRVSALIELGAGFHQDLTGRENIYLSGTILGMSRKEIKAKEDQIIDFSEIEEFIETPVKRYSSGMKARLGYAVAAHMKPDVLLVDEVLSVGDVRFRQKCLQHMGNLIRSNVTVIFISHLLEQVRQLCPNTAVLHHGRLVYLGPTDGAIQTYMDVLSDDGPVDNEDGQKEAEIKNIRLCDAGGEEVSTWLIQQPATIECDLVIHRSLKEAGVLVKFFTVPGVFLGNTGSRTSGGLQTASEPGVYRLKLTLDPLPFGCGDYVLHFFVYDYARRPAVVYEMPHPRMVSVRGGSFGSSLVDCTGRWELVNVSNDHAIVQRATG